MKTVYILTEKDWKSTNICGVLSSKKSAQEWIIKRNGIDCPDYIEMMIDKNVDNKLARIRWEVYMGLDGFIHEQEIKEVLDNENAKGQADKCSIKGYSGQWEIGIFAYSYNNEEEAIQFAKDYIEGLNADYEIRKERIVQ